MISLPLGAIGGSLPYHGALNRMFSAIGWSEAIGRAAVLPRRSLHRVMCRFLPTRCVRCHIRVGMTKQDQTSDFEARDSGLGDVRCVL